MMKQVRALLLLLGFGEKTLNLEFFFTISSTAVAAETQGRAQRQVKIKTQTNKKFQGAANMKMVKHKNKLWKIKTRKEPSEYGQDYQDSVLISVENKEGKL